VSLSRYAACLCCARPLDHANNSALQAKVVERLYTNLGGILRIAAICKKPDQAAFAELLSDLQGDIEAISGIKESNRKERDWFNHLSFVAEGSPAVAWITVV
jgi:adenylyl cyclase-associated protein